ncbi:MAG: M36 family metallopeptidase, partial [Bacteroidota bacterium]
VAKVNGLVAELDQRNLNPAPALSAQMAVAQALADLKLDVDPSLVETELIFLPTRESIRLTWMVTVDQHAVSSDYWLIAVDATDGRILDKDNQVLKSHADHRSHVYKHRNSLAHRHQMTREQPAPALPVNANLFTKSLLTDGAKYNVYAFGVESPIHGERSVEVDPADPMASPFGWHDTNGQEGPEFTHTRGNNVHAYRDRDDDPDLPDALRAEGGDSLVFDFFYENGADADTIARASITQLFYTNNMLHDWFFRHGFDEASGNFQVRNYSGDGTGGDPVLAEAQDGSGTNNANFFTPRDGGSGIMQMFLFTADAPELTVTTGGANIEGEYETADARFGPVLPVDTALVGELAIALDDSAQPELVCNTAVNGTDIAGKIALVTRGECNFENKVFNAQEGGAIAVIVCNDAAAGTERGGLIGGMADGDDVLDVRIPSLFITREDCAPIRKAVEEGEVVTVSIQDVAPPPIDSDFDAGIVAHEIGHGVSNRLVGGPNNVRCLNNDEQMGEGWSDFFSVASTPLTNLPNPDGTEPRGIGNFAIDGGINDRGIRSQPYSTDFAVNNKTYDDVIDDGVDAAPHPLGEIWAAVLLDLYWNLVNRDGMDPDLIGGTGGNNLAVRLVIEGMKYTRCEPGFLDGRDGILQADEVLYDGANSCLIWETFARRGLGFSASQGLRNDRTDNEQAFDLSPYCVGGVQLTKAVSETTIDPGDEVTYTLEAISYNPDVTKGVTVTDEIPAGMTLDESSVRGIENWTVEGSTLTFTLGEMEFEDIIVIEYTLASDPDLVSDQYFFDGVENGDDNWNFDGLIGNIFWEQNDTTPYAGNLAWYVPDVGTRQNQVLTTFEALPVTGDRPALRFFTKYETEARWDAGIVEISTDGTNWEKVDDKFLRGRYRGEISNRGTEALRDIGSWWGVSDDYVEIIVDLSEYAGQNVFVRFNWQSDTSVGRRGWWVDNIELLDVKNYESTARLTSDAGDDWTAEVGDLGVLVESQIVSNTDDPVLGQTEVTLFPNPAGDYVNVRVISERSGDASLQLIGLDGRVLHREQLNLLPGTNLTTVSTTTLPAGLYLVQVSGARRVSTTKLTIN